MAAKTNKPAPQKPETLNPEAPKAPDISPLISALAPHLSNIHTALNSAESSKVDIAVEGRSFRQENPEVERSAIILAAQTATAAEYGLKIEQVQNKPDDKAYKTLKNKTSLSDKEREKLALMKACNGAYQLSRELVSLMWAKDDKQDAKVAEAIEKGESRYTVLLKLSQKPQSNPQRDPDANKFTRANFSGKYSLWLTQVASDIGTTVEEVRELIDKAHEQMDAAPKD